MKLYLIGGFLGSGKTTAVAQLSQQLIRDKIKVAVITNDQGDQQVDKAFIKSINIPAEEVSNGCFCCNFDDLGMKIQGLQNEYKPDVIIAESVGSCTDLIATIVKPLNHYYPQFDVVVSVFVDAVLLSSVIAGAARFFEASVRYIFDKQIAESDVLVVNKADQVSRQQLNSIKTTLVSLYPNTEVLYQNSLDEEDISKWGCTINDFTPPHIRQSLNVDYDLYAEGEAQLAWLDKSIIINADLENGFEIALSIMDTIVQAIHQKKLTIGHLKFFLETESHQVKISYTTLGNARSPKLPEDECKELKMLINARVQTDPETLQHLIEEVIIQVSNDNCKIITDKTSSFKPGYPRPTHRLE